jgi:GTPase SAR1 family protein
MVPVLLGMGGAYIAKKAYDYFTEDDTESSYDFPSRPTWYKNTIVIGPKGSGKTTLAYLLADQEIDETQPTVKKTTVGTCISDYPGDEHCVDTDWADAIKKTACCIYVFNLKSYDDGITYENHNYQKLVLWHIDLIYDWIKNTKPYYQPQFIVIGTHSDALEKEAPNRILNSIKLELKKRNKEISIQPHNLLDIKSETLINTIERG